MINILKPKCNFLNGYFRCLLPSETMDVEVKVKMMRRIHMFRRDRTTQVISCNPWSTRLHPYPSLIQRMKIYLELEGKLCPKPRPQPQTQSQSHTSTPSQNNNSLTRKTPGPKMAEKKRRTIVPIKKVQGDSNYPALTYHPNYICTHESNPFLHSSHVYCIHPDAQVKSAAISSLLTIQFCTGKI